MVTYKMPVATFRVLYENCANQIFPTWAHKSLVRKWRNSVQWNTAGSNNTEKRPVILEFCLSMFYMKSRKTLRMCSSPPLMWWNMLRVDFSWTLPSPQLTWLTLSNLVSGCCWCYTRLSHQYQSYCRAVLGVRSFSLSWEISLDRPPSLTKEPIRAA